MSSVLMRIGQDGLPHPRRFIIFDEKFEMAPAVKLSMKEINEASTEFTTYLDPDCDDVWKKLCADFDKCV